MPLFGAQTVTGSGRTKRFDIVFNSLTRGEHVSRGRSCGVGMQGRVNFSVFVVRM